MSGSKIVMHRLISRLGLALICIAAPGAGFSQSLPVCSNQSSDADGDGFGWENQQSCQVTFESTSAPVVLNRATGAQVTLVRPYWNPQRDIENRTIQCDRYLFNAEQGAYFYPDSFGLIPGTQGYADNGVQYLHHPLSREQPWVGHGEALTFRENSRQPVWTVEDGLYRGVSFFSSQYLELIERDGVAAVRNWTLYSGTTVDSYVECFDVSGAPFEPSGYAGESPPVYPEQIDDLVVSEYSNPIAGDEPLSITNRETGQPVVLERVHWNVRKDLIGKAVQCQINEWSDYHGEYNFYSNYYADIHYFYPPTAASPHTFLVATEWYESVSSATLSVQDGVQQGNRVVMSRYIERVKAFDGRDAIRIWESADKYVQCTLAGVFDNRLSVTPVNYGLVPTGTPQQVGQCIDSDGDGWGWDGTDSCRVEVQPVIAGCIDSDGDGWGWDGSNSCRVTAQPVGTECIDTDGDGWGWDGVVSCRM